MATSYGSITITDKTDLGRLSVFNEYLPLNPRESNNSSIMPFR